MIVLHGGLDYVTVSMAVQRLRKRIAEDRALAKLAKQAVQMFNAKT